MLATITSQFIHLRCHSSYSIGEGSIDIYNLLTLCKNFNMPALGVTDSGNMYGAREFSLKLSQNGIQPIIGIQICTSFVDANNKPIKGDLILLATSEQGYKNLLKLHDQAYLLRAQNNLETVFIDFEQLCLCAEGIIALTGGTQGFLANILLNSSTDDQHKVINRLKEAFSNNLYIELNRFYKAQDQTLEPKFLQLALKYELPIVATNNVYFAREEDHEAADILLCIGLGVTTKETNRKVMEEQAYFKSPQEMINLFADLPEALENTIKIAKKCLFLVDKKPLSLPKFSQEEKSLIIEQSTQGLKERLEKEVFNHPDNKVINKEAKAILYDNYKARLDFELDVIIRMDFSGYFLIVSDFIKWAKNNYIPVGPGRGSGAGSLVAWALYITDINPMQFGLLFERFLNPERISMPDFDIDFCQEGRDKVVEYVRKKYGEEKVAHIITFGTLQPRAAIKDVGRAMGLPYSEVDLITKKIPYSAPSNPINLSKMVGEVDALKEEIDNKPHIKKLFEVALKLEGLYRNVSTHAAGVIISKDPLNEVVPLYYDTASTFPSVGFSMKYIEDIGLVKFDFLALKTLTIINKTVIEIKRAENIELDILQIPYQDQKISEIISRGDSLGVFQLESRGMTEVIKQLRPNKIEDIIAIISLYRPGPMENIPTYINRKHDKEKVSYLHPKMQSILEETFGIMIYQEQVMEVARVIAGYSLGGADILRRAMGKKDPKEMELQKNIFIKGALEHNGIDPALGEVIFDQMEKFAGYGFNKSHATAYALIAWQTGYLKAYYPAEFLASCMSADIGNNNKEIERFLEFLEEAKKYGISILPPSVNKPAVNFIIEKDNLGHKSIRFALLAVKGVGENLVSAMIEEIKINGEFISLEDFLTRIDNKLLNKKQLESLVKGGAFDIFNTNRRQLFENIEMMLNFNFAIFNEKKSNQISLFTLEGPNDSNNILIIKNYEDWNPQEKMREELEFTGCFLYSHPLNDYINLIEKLGVKSYNKIIADKINPAYIAAYLMKIKLAKSKNGTNFANLTFYDKASVFSMVLFGDNYNKFVNTLKEGEVYIIKTTMKIDEEDVKLFIENIDQLTHDYKIKEPVKSKKNKRIELIIVLRSVEGLDYLSNLLPNKPGIDVVVIKVLHEGKYLVFEIKDTMVIGQQISALQSLQSPAISSIDHH
ncbi:DNA polymerase III subunit alpha [Candidatus Hepatincolaceae symbiont of Richtersius coronifer]